MPPPPRSRRKKPIEQRSGPGCNRAVSCSAANADLVIERRYARDVMEESSHLGLDDESAGQLRSSPVCRISKAEEALSGRPVDPVRFLRSGEECGGGCVPYKGQ
jgi:hypothetical protein